MPALVATEIFLVVPTMGALPAAHRILLNCWVVRVPVRLPADCRLFKQVSTDCPDRDGAGSGMLSAAGVLVEVVLAGGGVATDDGDDGVGAGGVEIDGGTAAVEVVEAELPGADSGEELVTLAGEAQPRIIDALIINAAEMTNNFFIFPSDYCIRLPISL